MKEIEKARNQLIIPVSYVSVTNSTQATSPWAGSLEQEECVLSLMTLQLSVCLLTAVAVVNMVGVSVAAIEVNGQNFESVEKKVGIVVVCK